MSFALFSGCSGHSALARLFSVHQGNVHSGGFIILTSSFKSGNVGILMANTFSQIYIQTVFAVQNRLSLIRPEFKEDLYKYITGIVRNQGQKLISINDMANRVL